MLEEVASEEEEDELPELLELLELLELEELLVEGLLLEEELLEEEADASSDSSSFSEDEERNCWTSWKNSRSWKSCWIQSLHRSQKRHAGCC